ncbi:soluble lamin-associated protein of 75 kDa-like [Grus japonensis]|uniref:Soluble lamin-associated protein of 75 kDa-like n=1 Tax=Grus japonensis TaxID=30415 RepID=A0ABC9YIX5_GRUJA
MRTWRALQRTTCLTFSVGIHVVLNSCPCQTAAKLSTVGFAPLHDGGQTHKVLALFAPEDLLTAVALYLADQWWSTDDIVRTSVPSREGLQQVKSVGERVVLHVLN